MQTFHIYHQHNRKLLTFAEKNSQKMKKILLLLIAGLFLIPNLYSQENVSKKDVVEVFGEKQFNEIIKSQGLVLIDFSAIWCGPCRMMGPVLEQLSEETGVKVAKVDVDKNKTIAQKYRISSVPTLLLYKDGKIAWTRKGALSLEELKDVIARYQEAK